MQAPHAKKRDMLPGWIPRTEYTNRTLLTSHRMKAIVIRVIDYHKPVDIIGEVNWSAKRDASRLGLLMSRVRPLIIYSVFNSRSKEDP